MDDTTIEEAPVVIAEPREVEVLREALGDAVLKVKEPRGDLYVCIARDALLTALKTLRDHEELNFNYFSECLGVDYSRWEHDRDLPERFEVVYNLMSVPRARRIFLKIGVDDGQSVPSAKEIYLGAEYPEKEIGDLFGIRFEGNELPKGERFLLPDDWNGFPLRKEYPLGGEDVLFDLTTRGPAVEDVQMPHAGESFEGKTGSEDVSGR
jgi:NADH-quinone oxidoreductase subunit C